MSEFSKKHTHSTLSVAAGMVALSALIAPRAMGATTDNVPNPDNSPPAAGAALDPSAEQIARPNLDQIERAEAHVPTAAARTARQQEAPQQQEAPPAKAAAEKAAQEPAVSKKEDGINWLAPTLAGTIALLIGACKQMIKDGVTTFLSTANTYLTNGYTAVSTALMERIKKKVAASKTATKVMAFVSGRTEEDVKKKATEKPHAKPAMTDSITLMKVTLEKGTNGKITTKLDPVIFSVAKKIAEVFTDEAALKAFSAAYAKCTPDEPLPTLHLEPGEKKGSLIGLAAINKAIWEAVSRNFNPDPKAGMQEVPEEEKEKFVVLNACHFPENPQEPCDWRLYMIAKDDFKAVPPSVKGKKIADPNLSVLSAGRRSQDERNAEKTAEDPDKWLFPLVVPVLPAPAPEPQGAQPAEPAPQTKPATPH